MYEGDDEKSYTHSCDAAEIVSTDLHALIHLQELLLQP